MSAVEASRPTPSAVDAAPIAASLAPTSRAAWFAAATIAVAVLPIVVDARLFATWPLTIGALAAAMIADALVMPRVRSLRLRIATPSAMGVGRVASADCDVSFENARVDVAVEFRLDVDERFAAPETARFIATKRGVVRASIAITPRRRGTGHVTAAWVRFRGPLDLMQRTARARLPIEIAVTPDFEVARGESLRFLERLQSDVGEKSVRVFGEGSEFDSLREFAAGLDPRSIDWKTSARHRRLLAREHRAERNHAVVICLDTGRLMAERDRDVGGTSRLDRAITASLVLAAVAAKSGDRVGLHGFGARPQAWVAPVAGTRGFRRVRHSTADLLETPEETNFTLGLLDLERRLARRSLVVVFTEFADAISAELLIGNLRRIARRHLILFVAVRDPLVGRVAASEPRTLLDVHRALVADELERDRHVVLKRLARLGVKCIDTDAERMSTSLVNRYLEIRARELV